MTEKPFLMDIHEIRRRARNRLHEGAITSTYGSDLKTVLALLNQALATEIVCVLRYKRHYYMAQGIHSQSVAAEFLEHANEEMLHVDALAARIIQLRGEPDFNPQGILDRSHAEYIEGHNLIEMMREDLIAERIAIDSYAEMIRYIGDGDPTTRRMLEEILAVEEKHAEDLATLLQNIDQQKKIERKAG